MYNWFRTSTFSNGHSVQCKKRVDDVQRYMMKAASSLYKGVYERDVIRRTVFNSHAMHRAEVSA